MTPGYNIRIGKAADRLLFREMLSRLSPTLGLNTYRYVGLGGPFLEDFRLINESFPEMRLTSLEKTKQVWLRQKFHKPVRHVNLYWRTTEDYFANVHDESERVVVWLDYTDLRQTRLQEIWGVIPKLAPGSLLRVTLRAEGADAVDHKAREKWAQDIFGRFEPQYSTNELDSDSFASVLLRSVKRLTDDVVLQVPDARFQLLHAFAYNDGTQMLTFCGAVGDAALHRKVKTALQSWEFKNFEWSPPHLIELPSLSLKERLILEPLLPSRRGTGKELHKKLGYFIEDSEKKSITALDQYRQLSGAYPRFVRLAF